MHKAVDASGINDCPTQPQVSIVALLGLLHTTIASITVYSYTNLLQPVLSQNDISSHEEGMDTGSNGERGTHDRAYI